MTFSILIPTYNGAAYIETALLSALNQSRPADEIIISDDNSTDETIDICNKYANHIKIYINPNGPSGFVNGWNNAIKHATCEYISLLHQDDILAPTFLEEMEKAIINNPDVKHLFVPCNYINDDGEIKRTADYCDGSTKRYAGKEYVRAYQTKGTPHIHRCPGVVTHRDIFNVCKYKVEAGQMADDDFFYRVGQYTDVIGMLKPLAFYRESKTSATGRLEDTQLISHLSDDYIYQLKQWKNSIYMKGDSYNYFCYWAEHYSFDEYCLGTLKHNKALKNKGLSDMKEIESLDIKYSFKHRAFRFLLSLL